MKIVIDIPDCMFEVIKRIGSGAPKAIDDAIVNGTPLPKNYGRLIDAESCPYKRTVKDCDGDYMILCDK